MQKMAKSRDFPEGQVPSQRQWSNVNLKRKTKLLRLVQHTTHQADQFHMLYGDMQGCGLSVAQYFIH